MSRGQAAVLLLLAVPALWALMWWGWRGKVARSQLAPLPTAPTALPEPVFGPVEATYVSTTAAGDWLDRVASHRLGVRGSGAVAVHPGGVLVARRGEPDVWLPAQTLVGVRRQRGMAGKFADADGVVVVTWRHDEHLLDSGLRTRYQRDREPLTAAVAALVGTREEKTDA